VFGIFGRSLRAKLLLFMGIILLLAIGVFAYVSISIQKRQLMNNVVEEALRLSDIVKKTTQYSMIQNHREDVQRIIETVGSEKSIEKVRVFNGVGKIMVSSDQSEVGNFVDERLETCNRCHKAGLGARTNLSAKEKSRIFRLKDDYRVLGVINPIHNEEACYDCHDKKMKVLGTLDMVVSLADADRQIAGNIKRTITFAFSILLLMSAGIVVFIQRYVYTPVRQLVAGTEKIKAGDFGFAIHVRTMDEIGTLTDSFNVMARDLEKYRREIEEWNRELQNRVRAATSELQHTINDLKEVDRLRSEFVLIVSHDLRSPLATIQTCLKVVLDGILGEIDEKQRDMVHRAERQANTLLVVVKDLLDFSRIKVGRALQKTEPLLLTHIVQEIVDFISLQAGEKNVTLEVDIPSQLPQVYADRSNMERLFTNLIGNAVKYNRYGGSVTIRAVEKEDLVSVEISDTGIGIPKADIGKVFDIFHRAGNAKSTEEVGSGVGLSIVKQIVEAHGGTVRVQSEEGKGSVFTVDLPKRRYVENHADAPNVDS
jgi:two-component system, NtrC family, sensor kinase